MSDDTLTFTPDAVRTAIETVLIAERVRTVVLLRTAYASLGAIVRTEERNLDHALDVFVGDNPAQRKAARAAAARLVDRPRGA